MAKKFLGNYLNTFSNKFLSVDKPSNKKNVAIIVLQAQSNCGRMITPSATQKSTVKRPFPENIEQFFREIVKENDN